MNHILIFIDYLCSFYTCASKDSSQCNLYGWSMDFDIQVSNYSDISCNSFKAENNTPNVVISGPHGTDLINLMDCYRGNCSIINIENGKAGGARY